MQNDCFVMWIHTLLFCLGFFPIFFNKADAFPDLISKPSRRWVGTTSSCFSVKEADTAFLGASILAWEGIGNKIFNSIWQAIVKAPCVYRGLLFNVLFYFI